MFHSFSSNIDERVLAFAIILPFAVCLFGGTSGLVSIELAGVAFLLVFSAVFVILSARENSEENHAR